MSERETYIHVDLCHPGPSGILCIREPATVLFSQEYAELDMETLAKAIRSLELVYGVKSIRLDLPRNHFRIARIALIGYGVRAPVRFLRLDY